MRRVYDCSVALASHAGELDRSNYHGEFYLGQQIRRGRFQVNANDESKTVYGGCNHII